MSVTGEAAPVAPEIDSKSPEDEQSLAKKRGFMGRIAARLMGMAERFNAADDRNANRSVAETFGYHAGKARTAGENFASYVGDKTESAVDFAKAAPAKVGENIGRGVGAAVEASDKVTEYATDKIIGAIDGSIDFAKKHSAELHEKINGRREAAIANRNAKREIRRARRAETAADRQKIIEYALELAAQEKAAAQERKAERRAARAEKRAKFVDSARARGERITQPAKSFGNALHSAAKAGLEAFKKGYADARTVPTEAIDIPLDDGKTSFGETDEEPPEDLDKAA